MVIVAEPPASVPLAALLSQAVSRMLGSPVTLPLDALFGSSRDVLGQLRGVLAPGSIGTSTGQHTVLLQAVGPRVLAEERCICQLGMLAPSGCSTALTHAKCPCSNLSPLTLASCAMLQVAQSWRRWQALGTLAVPCCLVMLRWCSSSR